MPVVFCVVAAAYSFLATMFFGYDGVHRYGCRCGVGAHSLRQCQHVVEANRPLSGPETDVFADAGYQGAHKPPDAKGDVQ